MFYCIFYCIRFLEYGVNFTQKEVSSSNSWLFEGNLHNSDNMSSKKFSLVLKRAFNMPETLIFFAMNQVFICILEYENINGYFAQRIPLVIRIFKWQFWKYLQSWNYNLSFKKNSFYVFVSNKAFIYFWQTQFSIYFSLINKQVF